MGATFWIKRRTHLSWHLAREGNHATRCGLWVETPITADDLPLGEKSCETCLRLVEHDAEKAGA